MEVDDRAGLHPGNILEHLFYLSQQESVAQRTSGVFFPCDFRFFKVGKLNKCDLLRLGEAISPAVAGSPLRFDGQRSALSGQLLAVSS